LKVTFYAKICMHWMTLKMKTLSSFIILLSIKRSTHVDIPKDRNFHNTLMGSPNLIKQKLSLS